MRVLEKTACMPLECDDFRHVVHHYEPKFRLELAAPGVKLLILEFHFSGRSELVYVVAKHGFAYCCRRWVSWIFLKTRSRVGESSGRGGGRGARERELFKASSSDLAIPISSIV